MMRNKRLYSLVSSVLVLAILMSSLGVPIVFASEENDIRVTATTSTSVRIGDSVYCYVYIDSLEALSTLSVTVHYDPDKIKVETNNVYNVVPCSLSDQAVGESGVQFSYIFDGNGQATRTQLFYFKYTVLLDAEIGNTYFDIIVNEAYDSSLQPVAVSGSRCAFTVAELVTTKTCSIGSTSAVSTSVGEEFELTYRLSTNQVASGSMNIQYDPELFEVVSVVNGDFLTDKLVDVNTALDGSVSLSFVGTTYPTKYDVVTVRFKTLKNVTESSDIKLIVRDLYDKDLNLYSCNGYTTKANVVFDETYTENAPSMSVSSSYNAETDEVTVSIYLEKNAMLGAGDFVLRFNTDYFTYKSSVKGFSPTFFNINDKAVAEGVLKFSILSFADITEEQTVLTIVFDTPIFCEDIVADFDLDGNGLTDSMTEPILLNFVDASLSISGVGHDKLAHSAQAPTCTEIGWYDYDTCSRCDYTTYVEIPANGHSYIQTYCSVCGEKQPAYKAWDVSAAGDGSLMANLYENVIDGGLVLEICGTGEMADWTSTTNVPWHNAYRNQINCLIIEDGVTSIGARAFCNLTGVSNVSIPDSVETIGNYAFFGCTALKSITIPKNITTIGQSAFSSCSGITALFLGSSVKSIGSYAFSGCTALASITIPESVTDIGTYAFNNCRALTEINFCATAMNDLAGNNYVFGYAGIDADGITVHIGANVTKIPAYLFYPMNGYDPKITSVVFAENSACKTIGTYAFAYLKDLTEIIIPEGVESIGNSAFLGCTALASMTIPESVTDIGTYAFNNCKALTEINFCATAMNDLASNNYVFGYAGIDADGITVHIGANVTKIPAYLFYPKNGYAPKITSVVFAENSACKTIGASAFSGCTALASITIPESVTDIGTYAFYNCRALTEINFCATAMNDLASDNYVFSYAGVDAEGITVHIGANVTKIPAYLFYPSYYNSRAPKITSIVFAENSACKTIGAYAFTYLKDLTEIIIPEGVESIGKSAFSGCTALASMTIPESVTDIGSYAFYSCSGITALVLGSSVKSIGASAFDGCTALASITIPESVTDIGTYAFNNCKALTEINFCATAMNDLASSNYVFGYAGIDADGITVHIGANVTKIPAYLFYPKDGCAPKITSIVFAENSACKTIGAAAFTYLKDLTEIIIPEGVESIGSYAFSSCTALASIVIPDSVYGIKTSTFSGCTGLVSVHMPDTLTVIESYAFNGCSSLKQIVIPEGVTSIGNYAFSSSGLKLVYIGAEAITKDLYQYASWSGLLNSAVTVLIPATIKNIDSYISNFPKVEKITYKNVDYVAYSRHSHSWIENEVLSLRVACEQDGCIRYICSDCGAFKDAIIFRHDVVINAAKEPTCTEVGWHEYHTCSNCDYTTYSEVPALGHKVIIDNRLWMDSYVAVDGGSGNYGLFNYTDGVFASTNHGDNSVSRYVANVTDYGWLQLHYRISSESCDELRVYCNGNTLVSVSGEFDYWMYYEFYVYPGDRIVVEYTKDGSVNCGEDTAWFYFADDSYIQSANQNSFSLENGYYMSTNKDDDSHSVLTLQILNDSYFDMSYYVSSEAGYDRFIVQRNGETCVDASGEYYEWMESGIYVYPGDIITISYTKDGSGSSGEDVARFMIYDNGCEYQIVSSEKSFECVDGRYTVNDLRPGERASMKFEILYDCSFNYNYTMYNGGALDCLEFFVNGNCWYTLTGSWCGGGCSSSLNPGDIVEIVYTKNDAEYGYDYGAEFTFECSQTPIGEVELHPAENFEPTCTEAVMCGVCNEVARAALGHDAVLHPAQAPTCTGIGWDAYETCSRCNYTTYAESPASGHSYGDWVSVDLNQHQHSCACGESEQAEHVFGENGLCALCNAPQYIPGDVTGDGQINTRDLVRLSQYISDGCQTKPDGYNAKVVVNACDVTGDGQINTRDLVRLSQYISDGCITNPNGYNAVLNPGKVIE